MSQFEFIIYARGKLMIQNTNTGYASNERQRHFIDFAGRLNLPCRLHELSAWNVYGWFHFDEMKRHEQDGWNIMVSHVIQFVHSENFQRNEDDDFLLLTEGKRMYTFWRKKKSQRWKQKIINSMKGAQRYHSY